MDWSRAKSILIVAFIGLNLFLSYRLWGQPLLIDRPTGLISAQEMDETVGELLEEGVQIRATIPSRIPSMATLTVTVDTVELMDVPTRYFGEDVPGARVEYKDDTETIIWRTELERLELHSQGRTVYMRQPLAPGEAPELDGRGVWDTRRACEVGERFLAERGLNTPELVVEEVSYDVVTEAYVVTFIHEYQSWPLYEQIARVVVGHWGVLSVEYTPLQVGPFALERQRVIPATEALLIWARYYRDGNDTISTLELGYRRLDDETAFPVWRVGTEDGLTYFLNGFTGDLVWYGQGL